MPAPFLGHAVVEIELWQAGAGRRAGHQPFDVAILHEDLLEYAAGELRRPQSVFHRDRARQPTPTRSCRICDEMAGRLPEGLRMGYANSNSEALTIETNRLAFTTPWCRETSAAWLPRACPPCLGQAPAAPALLCRRHLAAQGELSRDTGAAVAHRLLEIRARLLGLIESMTDHGEPATAEDDASWIEAVGWFAGWGVPFCLSRPGKGP
ncbi:hypothetical protein ACQCSX_01565 [Pseudarthrobacter sp. P1]|uniref:hypothetical protein n=1 Tax=Pseudarthrobacter sp. P1 TaxID=3418418 RepID=UPI003CF53BAD